MNSASTNDGGSPGRRRDRQHQQHGADQHGGGEADDHGLLGVQSSRPEAGHPPPWSVPRTRAHDATLFRSAARRASGCPTLREWGERGVGRWPRIGSRRHEQVRCNPFRRPRHPAPRGTRARCAHRRAAVPARRHRDDRPPRRDAARGARARERDPADDHRAHGVPLLRDDARGGASSGHRRSARRGRRGHRRPLAGTRPRRGARRGGLVRHSRAGGRVRRRERRRRRGIRVPVDLDGRPARDARGLRGDRPAARPAGHPHAAVGRRHRIRREHRAQLRLHLRARLGHRRVGVGHGRRAVGHGRRVPRGRRAARGERGGEPVAAPRRSAARGPVGRMAVPAHRKPAARRCCSPPGRRPRSAPTSSPRSRSR